MAILDFAAAVLGVLSRERGTPVVALWRTFSAAAPSRKSGSARAGDRKLPGPGLVESAIG